MEGGREVTFLLPDDENGTRRLCAVVYGSRDAPALLCLHGFQDNANSFASLAPKLARNGFFVVCLEFTGHGKSDHSSGQLHHFSYVYDVVDVADSLQLEGFHLIGHSMGGVVAILVAGSLVRRVLSLALIDAIGVVGDDDAEAPVTLERALLERTAMISRRPRIYDSFDECLARWSEATTAPMGDENVRLIVSRGTEEIVDPRGFVSGFRFRHDPRLKALSPFKITDAASQAFLRRVACPRVALLATDRRVDFWPRELEDQRMEMLGARVVRLQGGHHLHMYEGGVAAHAALVEFYAQSGILPLRSRL